MKVPHLMILMSIRPMECWLATLNASSATMSHALEQTKAARTKSSARVLPVSSLLACRKTVSNLFSNLSFPHTPCSFPVSASCRLLSRHSVPTSGEFSLEQVGISWHFSNISSDTSALWAHVSTSLDVNKANGMLTSNAKRIFYNIGGDIGNMSGTIHTLGWKMSLLFFVWHPPCFRL